MEDVISSALSTLWERIQEKLLDRVGDSIKHFFEKFSEGFKKNGANIIVESIEILNHKTLVEIATKHKVEGSSEVAAYKINTVDEYIVYLAYVKERELLDESINRYIIIRSQSISRDVEKLFNNDQLILLK